MNLEILRRQRKRPVAGDLFVYKMRERPYGFGRVIKTAIYHFEDTYLIYIYDAFSLTKRDIPEVRPDRLLVPPIITWRTPWKEGYFETITNRPLSRAEVLPVHCFHDRSTVRRPPYVDDRGKPLTKRIEPCGEWSLSPLDGIDDDISRALGLPIAPSAPPGPPQPLDGPGVSVFLKLSGEGFGSAEDQARAQDLIDRLDEALERARLGVFEGDEFGGGYCAIFLRSRNVERLTELVRSVLRATPPPPGSYLLQYRPKSQGGPQRIELA